MIYKFNKNLVERFKILQEWFTTFLSQGLQLLYETLTREEDHIELSKESKAILKNKIIL